MVQRSTLPGISDILRYHLISLVPCVCHVAKDSQAKSVLSQPKNLMHERQAKRSVSSQEATRDRTFLNLSYFKYHMAESAMVMSFAFGFERYSPMTIFLLKFGNRTWKFCTTVCNAGSMIVEQTRISPRCRIFRALYYRRLTLLDSIRNRLQSSVPHATNRLILPSNDDMVWWKLGLHYIVAPEHRHLWCVRILGQPASPDSPKMRFRDLETGRGVSATLAWKGSERSTMYLLQRRSHASLPIDDWS